MALDLTALEAEVGRLTAVRPSVEALLDRLFADFEANKGNPAAIQALVNAARSDVDGLTASVVKNTPVSSEPVPPA